MDPQQKDLLSDLFYYASEFYFLLFGSKTENSYTHLDTKVTDDTTQGKQDCGTSYTDSDQPTELQSQSPGDPPDAFE